MTMNKDFKIGDEVTIDDLYPYKEFRNEFGIIIGISFDGNYLVKFGKKLGSNQHNGNNNEDPSRTSRYFGRYHMLLGSKEEILKKREESRLKYIEIDPYGEDDWTNESVQNKDFKIGDEVTIDDSYYPVEFKTGIIIGISGFGNPLVKFSRKLGNGYNKDNYQHSGHYNEDPSGMSRYFPDRYLKHGDLEVQKKRMMKKEEIRLKHIDIDPYGEDDWTNESVQNKDFKIGDEVTINDLYPYKEFRNEIGIILSISGSPAIKFGRKLGNGYNQHDADGRDSNFTSRYISVRYLEPIDPEESKRRKKERLKKQEESRLKYIEIDPYGEDEWENEKIKIKRFDDLLNEWYFFKSNIQ